MPINRRAFLQLAAGATTAAGLGVAIPGYATACRPNNLILERKQVRLPNLPNAFDGFRIVLLADLHLHPFTTLHPKSSARFRKIFLRRVSRHPLWRGRCRSTSIPSFRGPGGKPDVCRSRVLKLA